MNRTDLQNLATIRLEEAKALLTSGHSSGAYYLAGYAVEYALKAVIVWQTQQFDFPDKQRAIESFVHDLEKLLSVAKLDGLMRGARLKNRHLDAHWEMRPGGPKPTGTRPSRRPRRGLS